MQSRNSSHTAPKQAPHYPFTQQATTSAATMIWHTLNIDTMPGEFKIPLLQSAENTQGDEWIHHGKGENGEEREESQAFPSQTNSISLYHWLSNPPPNSRDLLQEASLNHIPGCIRNALHLMAAETPWFYALEVYKRLVSPNLIYTLVGTVSCHGSRNRAAIP